MSKKHRRAKSKYCWDTSVFLAWLWQEDGAPLDDIALIIDEIDSDKASLICPAIVHAEVLQVKVGKKRMGMFLDFLQRSNVLTADLTAGLAQEAGLLRGKCLKERPERKLKTPDASVVVTAMAYGVDALHSLDPHILNLTGSKAVNGLSISMPHLLSRQMALPGIICSRADQ